MKHAESRTDRSSCQCGRGEWGCVCITSLYPKFNRSHFGLPPSSIRRMTGWVAISRIQSFSFSTYSVNTQFRFIRTKTSGPESNRIDSHTLWIRITRNRLTRNFGLYNCQIFPRRRSFRFVRRKIAHSTIETDASRAFVASTAGLAVRPYLLYNFSCILYKFCRMCSIFEISGFRGFRIFFFYYIISVSKHTFPGSPELRTNQN